MKQTRMQIVAALLGALLVLPMPGFAQESAEVALRAAMETETVEGDLDSAIEQYGKLAEISDRAIAAHALIRMAGCYEKLGAAQAREIYERVVREFGDQTESVTTAQARLAALPPAADSKDVMSARHVWTTNWIDGTVSADGRLVSFTDWSAEGNGNLAVHDLVAGAKRLLTHKLDGDGSYSDGSLISPDGRQVAYLWNGEDEEEFHIRIVSTDGEGTPRIVYRSTRYAFLEGWTPDGENLLISRSMEDRTWQIALLSLADGAIRQLKSLQWGRVGASLSPDGRYIAFDAPSGEGSARDIFVLAADGSQETTLVRHPANDYSTLWSPDGSQVLFVSDRTATPSLWSISVKDGRAAGEASLVKNEIGDSKLIGISDAGTLYHSVSRRSRRNIYRAALGDAGRVSGNPIVVTDSFFNSNWGATLSPDGESLAFYSFRPRQSLVIRNLSSGQERVFPVDQGEIRTLYFEGPQWFPDSRSVLVWVRQNQRPGDVFYRFDTVTAEVQPLDVHGGTNLKVSPDGSSIFYKTDASTRLARFDLGTGRETTLREASEGEHISDLAISPDGKQLAYNLQVERADAGTYFYVLPSNGGDPHLVHEDSPGFHHARFNTLRWTPDQRYLLFVKDVETPKASIWRVSLDSGEAEKVGVEMEGIIKAPQLHPDGKSLFFTKLETGAELWVLENFLQKETASR